MKHLFIFLFASCLIISTAKAQTPVSGWRVGFGVDAGVPVTKAFKYSLGGDIRLQKQFSGRIAGTLTAGFTHYFENDHYADFPYYSSPFNVIPVKAGVKLFVADNLYIGGEAGAGFGMEEWGASFLWSPSLGLTFSNGIDIGIKYEDYTRNSATKNIALLLAYCINGSKAGSHPKSNMPEGWLLSVSLDPGLLTNNSDDLVIGADISLKHKLNNNLEASISAGISHYSHSYYNYYLYKNPMVPPVVLITSTEQNVFPVEAGMRLFAGNRFFVQGQAGAAFGLNGTVAFMYSPSFGLTFENGFEVGAKYDNFNSQKIRDVIALKLGYNFKL